MGRRRFNAKLRSILTLAVLVWVGLTVRLIFLSSSDWHSTGDVHLRLLDQLSAFYQSATRNRRQYLRFDDAAPKPIAGSARSHGLPSAVPARRAIPREMAEDKQYHYTKKTDSVTSSFTGERGNRRPYFADGGGEFNWNHSYALDNRALYLFNPAILPLHNTIHQPEGGGTDTSTNTDPDFLSQSDLNELTGGDENVRYVAIFSANTGGNCFGPKDKRLMQIGDQIAYYGVALLDEHLDLIPDTDVLIDLNAGPNNGKYFRQTVGDCRIFLMKGAIYFLCLERLLRIEIRRIASRQQSTNESYTSRNDMGSTHTGRDLNYPYVYPRIYGTGLEITLLSNQKITEGKNRNIFRSASTTAPGTFDYYLQSYPLPHKYNRLIVPARGVHIHVKAGEEQESNASLPYPSFDGPDTPNTIITCPENEQGGSTWTTNCTNPNEEPFFGDHDHGTACCLSMSLGGFGEVLVGISHTKTTLITNPWWRRDIRAKYNDRIPGRRYLSRFVAYRPIPPFDIVARSGWFCLGFADADEYYRAGGNSLAFRNEQYQLDLFDDTYQCPIIHFPSSISEVVGNASRAIIAYGINDCYHRIVVVEKTDIAKRLLGI